MIYLEPYAIESWGAPGAEKGYVGIDVGTVFEL